MAIHNRIGQTSYRRTMPRGYPGQPAEAKLPSARAYRVPKRKQIKNIAISGFGADTDAITVSIEEPNGNVLSYSVVRAAAVPVDDAAAAVALAALINNSSGEDSARGVVVASTSTTNLILTFQHEGYGYDVETTVVGCTATVTETQGPSGTAVPIARFVALASDAAIDGQRAIQLPDGAVANDICGIVLRTLTPHVNAGSMDPDDDDMIQPGNMADVAYEGAVLMINGGAAAASERDRVWVVVDDADGGVIGQAMSAASVGGVGDAQVSTFVPTVDLARYGFTLRLGGETYVARYVPTDATTTVADAIDGLYDSLVDQLNGATAAANGKHVTITESDTALTITTDPGYVIDDLSPSDYILDAEVPTGVATVGAGSVGAVELPTCYWAEDTPAGALGKVYLRL